MRDNDIRKIFDSAVEENTNTDIDVEKIQDTVMERIGKRQSENISFYESEDMEKRVEPVFVTAPAGKSHKWAVMVSAAAAVCIAVAAVSTNFFGIGGNLTAMTDTSELTDIPETEGVGETNAETSASEYTQTEKTEVTYNLEFIPNPPEVPYGSMEEYMGNELPWKNSVIYLTDGEMIERTDDSIKHLEGQKREWLLSEKDGRVYFWNGKEKKDVTELINIETPYVESYVNEYSGLTHYIILGGDVVAGKYGYAECFATYDSNRMWEFHAVGSRDSDEVKNILWYIIQVAIKNETGEEHLSGSRSFTCADFKSNTLVCDR